jgi:hypothetical protein
MSYGPSSNEATKSCLSACRKYITLLFYNRWPDFFSIRRNGSPEIMASEFYVFIVASLAGEKAISIYSADRFFYLLKLCTYYLNQGFN